MRKTVARLWVHTVAIGIVIVIGIVSRMCHTGSIWVDKYWLFGIHRNK